MTQSHRGPAQVWVDPGLLRRHLAYVESDNAWQQRARLLQSLWREDHVWAPGSRAADYADVSAARLGSRVSVADGDAGVNFLTPLAHQAALVAHADKHPDALMSRDRLLRDLLSSQPLCFNLFAALRDDKDLAARVLRTLLPHLCIDEVEEIAYEYSPGRGDSAYSGDKSAFDVAVWYSSGTSHGMLGIEVKYHENLAQRDAREHDFKPWFPELDEAGLMELSRPPLGQLARDHRLARAMSSADRALDAGVTWVLLYPAMNTAVARAAAAYRALLPHARDRVAITIEAFTAAAMEQTSDAWPDLLRARYVDMGRLAALGVADQRPSQPALPWNVVVSQPTSEQQKIDQAHWQRWWLAAQLHDRWYRPLGIEVQGAYFAPLDGDLYSLPVWSPACARAARYFGRLSPGIVHIDPSHATELGVPPAVDEAADVELPLGLTDDAVLKVEAVLGLGKEDGHEACAHATGDVDYPSAWLLALLVRTIGGSVLQSGRQLIQMPATEKALERHVRYHCQEAMRGDWLAVVAGDELVCALHPSGAAVTPDACLDHRALLRHLPMWRIAAELDPLNFLRYLPQRAEP